MEYSNPNGLKGEGDIGQGQLDLAPAGSEVPLG